MPIITFDRKTGKVINVDHSTPATMTIADLAPEIAAYIYKRRRNNDYEGIRDFGVQAKGDGSRMIAVLLPNGNILAPKRAEDGAGIVGDAMVEIGPDDPDFAVWMEYLQDDRANQ